MSPLWHLRKRLSGYAKERPRLQRLLCRIGIHARMVIPLGVAFDGVMICNCTSCGARIEVPGF